MRRKINADVTAFGILTMLLFPIIHNGGLHQLWEWFGQADFAAVSWRELSLLLVIGVQMLPAFWFGCLWGGGWVDYWINMLSLGVLACLVRLAQKNLLSGEAS